jgi:hypothetical protein
MSEDVFLRVVASWRAKSCETPFSPFGIQRETSAIMYQLCFGGAFLGTREPTSFPARRAPPNYRVKRPALPRTGDRVPSAASARRATASVRIGPRLPMDRDARARASDADTTPPAKGQTSSRARQQTRPRPHGALKRPRVFVLRHGSASWSCGCRRIEPGASRPSCSEPLSALGAGAGSGAGRDVRATARAPAASHIARQVRIQSVAAADAPRFRCERSPRADRRIPRLIRDR